MTSQELLGAVLDLPSNERARFARELLHSLDEQDGDPSDDAELVAELDRRRAQADAGEVRMLDRIEFEQAIAQRRAARRSS
ncbi:MAG: addiction module protein [Deltaproteobacteria bacterium]|nr:addiction module protein [Deltaproteobacteria bacterium]